MSKTTETDTFRRLKAFMKDVDGDQRQIIKCLQDQVEYLLEKNRICEEVAVEKNGGKQISLSDDQKKRLAVKGKRLNEFLLGSIEQIFALFSRKSTTCRSRRDDPGFLFCQNHDNACPPETFMTCPVT